MNEIKGVSGIDQAVNAICTELEERKADALNKANELATIATTAENLPERKKDRAAVNKMKLDFDRERKDFEAKWKSAIGPVSDAYKRIVGQLDASIKKIDKDLEDFEVARVEAKKKRIEEIYAEVEKPAEIADWLPLERIFHSKWLNVSASDKSIREAIQQEFDGMEMAYNSLTSIEHEWEKEGLEVLRETKSLELAMKKMTDLRKQAELIEQRRREEEERKRREEEARRKAEEERQRQEAEEKARAEEEARKKAEEEAQKAFEEPEFEAEEEFQTEPEFEADPEPEFESEPEFVENTEPEFLDDIPTEPAFDEPEEDENTVYLNYVIRIKARDNQKLMTILDQSGIFYEIDEVM